MNGSHWLHSGTSLDSGSEFEFEFRFGFIEYTRVVCAAVSFINLMNESHWLPSGTHPDSGSEYEFEFGLGFFEYTVGKTFLYIIKTTVHN